MFNGWDIFHSSHMSQVSYHELVLNSSQFADYSYSNIDDSLPKDLCKLSKHLWDMIDWSN